jgi:hypothetical protein
VVLPWHPRNAGVLRFAQDDGEKQTTTTTTTKARARAVPNLCF